MDCASHDFVLETPRLVLRPPEADDVEGLWPHVSNAEITTFLAWEPHPDRSVTAGLIAGLQRAQEAGTGYHWVVTLAGAIVGLVSLIDVKRRHLSWTLDRAEIAYWIAPEHQRKGYAFEACEAVIAFGFRALGLYKIRVAHATENTASERLSLRLGFKKYAVERKAFCKDGRWHDLVWYDLLRSEAFPDEPEEK